MIIDDDKEWVSYYQTLLSDHPSEIYHNCIAAIDRMNTQTPSLILLDILLIGPTGFSILHEMQSYPELAKIPVIIASSVDLGTTDLTEYGVVRVFNKSTMHPRELKDAINRFSLQPVSPTATIFNHKQEY